MPESIKCDHCTLPVIDGVPCREFGCPYSGWVWFEGEWVRFVACTTCGDFVRWNISLSCTA